MKLAPATMRGFAWAAAALCSLAAAAQTLTITNGVWVYPALTNTVVTLTGRCELRITATNNPIPGCLIHLDSPDAWFLLLNIKPSNVAASCLGQVRVNGANAVAGTNCRVVEFGMGTVIVPHGPGFQPLQVFSDAHFTGTSNLLSQYTAYADAGLGGMNNNISSFRLRRGYMATFAQNGNGSGLSWNFVAADGDLDVAVMPPGLDNTVSFVRVFPWRWTAKKGIAGNIPGNLNVRWYYNWNIDQNSSLDWEYVPIRQNRWWPDLNQNWQTRGANHLLGYNEPDKSDQANIAVGDAVWSWPDLLATGLRVGSPATTDGGRSSWLYPFIQQADAAGLRVDFVALHYYWCYDPANPSGAASQMYNFLLDTYNHVKRPLWVTEWNNGANWTSCADPTYAQQQACIAAMIDMLENAPFVERYALYNWVEDVRAVETNGVLTPAGVTYRDKASRIGYVQDGIPGGVRSPARFQFESDVLDSSGFGNHGIAVGIPGYTPGPFGQAIRLDGTNHHIILPSNIANAAGFSFAAWVFWEGGGNWQRIFDFGNGDLQYLFLTPSSGSGTLRFAITTNGYANERIVQTAAALPVGQWRHVAVTLSNNVARLYLNGALVAASNNVSILPAQFGPKRNYLGKSQFAADPLFRGRLDEVIVTPYALTAAEIAALQTNQPPQFPDLGDGFWTANANGNWSDPAMWNGGLPANGAGQTADFSLLDITAHRTVTLDSSRRIGALQFGDLSGAQNWTLAASGGSVLTLDKASATQPVITVNQNTATISAPLAGTNGFAKTGSGTLVLSGTNSLSGAINIDTSSTTANEGVVRLAGPQAVANVSTIWIRNNNSGSSTLQLDGSLGNLTRLPTIRLSGRNTNVVAIQNLSGSNSLGALTIDVGGSFYLLQSDAGTLNLGGTVSSLAGGTRTLTFQGNGNFNVSGSIQNGSAATIHLLKTNAGTLTIAGASTFSGTTTNWRGTLLVNGSLACPVTVVGGTLGGCGSISGATLVQSGGALSPGAGLGILTVSNNVTLQVGSRTVMEINATPLTNDQLRVTGALNCGGTLVVTNLGGELGPGDTFRLFQAGSYNGAFTSLSLPPLNVGLAWDTDGLTNGILAVVATNPPTVTGVALQEGGAITVRGVGSAGQRYTLRATTNLAPQVVWSAVTSAVADTNGVFQLADPQAASHPRRFYRVTVP